MSAPEIVEIDAPSVPSVVEVSGGRGATGATGPRGLQGEQGPQGEPGPTSWIWWSKNAVEISNTAARSSQLDPAGEGSLVLSPEFWEPGRHLDFTTRGWIRADNGQTTTFEIVLASLLAEIPLVQSEGTLPNGLNGADFYVEARFGVRCLASGSSGRLVVAGRTLIQLSSGINTVAMRSLLSPGEIAIDLSQELTFGVYYRWHTASAGNQLRLLMAEIQTNH